MKGALLFALCQIIFVLPLFTIFPSAREFYVRLFLTSSLATNYLLPFLVLLAFVGWKVAPAYGRAAWPLFYAVWMIGHVFSFVFPGSGESEAWLGLCKLLLFSIVPIVVYLRKSGVRVTRLTVSALTVLALFHISLILLQGFRMFLEFVSLFSEEKAPVYRLLVDDPRAPLRAIGIDMGPTTAAILLAATWPVCLYGSVGRRTPQELLWLTLRLCLAFAAGLACIATYTRAAYLALLVQLVFIAYVGFSRKSLLSILTFAAALTGFLGGIFWLEFGVARVGQIADTTDLSILHRLLVWQRALEYFLYRPICGWGPDAFATLFYRIDRLPLTDYSFFNVHSAVFNSIFQFGLAGVGLGMIAVLGLAPWATLRKTPLFVKVGLIGLFVTLIPENPSFYFPPAYVILLYLGVLASVAVTVQRRKAVAEACRRRWWVPYALFALWLGAFLVPPKPLEAFIEAKIARECRRMRARSVAYSVHNYRTGWSLQKDPHTTVSLSVPCAAVCLANLLADPQAAASFTTAALALELKPSVTLTARRGPLATLLHDRPSTISLTTLACFALAYGDELAASTLLNACARMATPWAECDASSTTTPAQAPTGLALTPDFLPSAPTTAATLTSRWGSVSLEQLEEALYTLATSQNPAAEPLAQALQNHHNIWGLSREVWFRGGTVWRLSAETPDQIVDALVFQGDGTLWSACFVVNPRIPRYDRGADHPIWNALAKIGWHLYCFNTP